jgi:hypothetical protein
VLIHVFKKKKWHANQAELRMFLLRFCCFICDGGPGQVVLADVEFRMRRTGTIEFVGLRVVELWCARLGC